MEALLVRLSGIIWSKAPSAALHHHERRHEQGLDPVSGPEPGIRNAGFRNGRR